MSRPTTMLFAIAAFCALGAEAAEPIPVSITVDTGGESTRVVLTAASPVHCNARPAPGAIEVTCADPIAPKPEERKVDDPVLAGWKRRGDRMIVLATGPGYQRFDSFALENPARLVLDLTGTRPRAAGAGGTSSPAATAPKGPGKPVIVLDPGHGGVETGAVGPTGLQEKDVTLDLARRLERVLERDGVVVVLTRDEDKVLPLDERTAVANHNKAELFVSIHLNASRRPSAFGAETYFSSPESTDDEARTLAALENKAYAPGDASPAPGGGNMDPGIEMILWDLAQNQYLAESGRLAESIQRELNASTGVRDRGVRQAPFRVLMGATMPAILVEVGFVSNPQEEARLKDDAYKDKIVDALARAIREFRGRRAAADGVGAGKP